MTPESNVSRRWPKSETSDSGFTKGLFDVPFHLVDLFLGQIGDLFEAGDAEGFTLGFTPALQAVGHFDFIAHAGGLVEVGAQQLFGEILLGEKVLFVHVRVDIALSMPERSGVPAGILQVGGYTADTLLFDALKGLEV